MRSPFVLRQLTITQTGTAVNSEVGLEVSCSGATLNPGAEAADHGDRFPPGEVTRGKQVERRERQGKIFVVKHTGSWSILWMVFEEPGIEQGELMEQKPWVEKEECISCGICAAACPQVFRLDGHGKSECYNHDGAPEDQIKSVATERCPVSCIVWAGQAA